MHPQLPPAIAARFRVEGVLTDTPFEVTLRAFDEVLQRPVVLKLPAREAAAHWTAPVRERLLREARALARIRHTGVAAILDVVETADGPLLVLEANEGELLADRLRDGALAETATVALGIAIGEALAQVHAEGVVHRAVGPSTIRLLASGSARLGAFTFAKEFGPRDLGTSLHHRAAGTGPFAAAGPDYSAPEQVAGRAADPRADVFALGCTLYQCVVGREPSFVDGTQIELGALRTKQPRVDPRLVEVIRTCTLFAKTARFSTAADVVAALRRIDGTERRGAASWSPGRRGVLLLAAAGLVAIGGAWLGPWSRAATGADGGRSDGGQRDPRYTREFSAEYRNVHGLFVGIDDYRGTGMHDLANPVHEIETVAAQLRANDAAWKRDGAQVLLCDTSASDAAIRRELQRLRGVGTDDAVLVWLAGHGVRQGRSFGFCARDMRGPLEGGSGYLRSAEIWTFLDECPAKHVLVVLDCCHSGAVLEEEAAAVRRGRAVVEQDVVAAHHRRLFSREFLCSSSANQEASDGLGLSPFCALVLEELRRPATRERPYVVGRFLSSRVEEGMDHRLARFGVQQTARFAQTATDAGSFVFMLAPAGR
ncbi:MAG: caspase family protein [Planctomycetes bacterium]|nr:caspase family protein [Planctomycetota bacterium]